MSLIAVIGAAVLGVGVTATRVYAGAGCVDYACVGHAGCQGKNCDICHTDSRCAIKVY